MKWPDLVKLEPRLGRVLAAARTEARKARHAKATGRVCANDIWYGTRSRAGLKSQVERLVGYARKEGPLSTSAAYDLVVENIYEALPDCKNCGCA